MGDEALLGDPTIAAWLSYSRPAEYEVALRRVRVAMPDGVELDCHLSQPACDGTPLDGPFPGLVAEMTPYALLRDMLNDEASWYAARGYMVLVASVRGTGTSGGEWMHAMSSQDGRDAADLVEWLGERPACDGRVGQLGGSYGGQTAYGAAVERPPHLRAIAPMLAPGNLYDDVIYPGGIKTTERGLIDAWPPGAAMLSDGRIDADAEYTANRSHPTFDDYWSDRALVGRIRDIEVPVLAIAGWKDEFFRSGSLSLIEEGLDKTWTFYGPWTHTGGMVSRDEPPDDGRLSCGVVLAWFDRWLRDDDAPIPEHPTFASYEGPEDSGAGWRLLAEWTPAGHDITTWSLGADLSLTGRPDAGVLTIEQPREPAAPRGALSFSSAPLDADRVLVGWPIVEFDAVVSGGDANLYVELLDLDPDGTETLVNDGFLKASHRTSHTNPSPAAPDAVERYTVKVRAGHWRFLAGHRVTLRISGGTSDRLVPVPEPARVDLHAGATATLSLPGFAAVSESVPA
jgi:uncharacterized protein